MMMAAAGCAIVRSAGAEAGAHTNEILFDGSTLDGWIMVENSATSVSGSDITDLAALAKSIGAKADGVAAFVNAQLDDAVRAGLSAFASSNATDDKTTRSALAKNLTKIVVGPLIYDTARFQGVPLRRQTQKLLAQSPHGLELVELNRMLLVDAFPKALSTVSPGWVAKNGAMASTGSGRGVIYTVRDYGRFRLLFTMRHVSGDPDHQACVLIFCTRPSPDEVPLDALAGIQFQVPKGGHWDYRQGRNDAGGAEFTTAIKTAVDPHEWSRIEIVADAATGMARMAVAQPLGSKAVEIVDFHDPAAGKAGPIALQMHNAGLFDEYKDLSIEVNPGNLELITVA